jgi:hypothetical protein
VTRHIVYTRHDGGVSICHPAPSCVAWLGCGGFWNGRTPESLEDQVKSSVAQGRLEWAARRFIRAMDKGGCTEAEAYAIIRDRDCAHLGTGFEVWDSRDLPQDRWFRDAWRRSANGGPIGIDMKAARRIQTRRIISAAQETKATIQAPRWRERIRRATMPEELRHVWPLGLGR